MAAAKKHVYVGRLQAVDARGLCGVPRIVLDEGGPEGGALLGTSLQAIEGQFDVFIAPFSPADPTVSQVRPN